LYAITDLKLIIIIVKSANICIHCTYRKSFWPPHAQLGMPGAIFAMVPVVALTATVTEQIKCHTYYYCYYVKHVIQSSLGMVSIQKLLQWAPIEHFLHMFNMTTLWWWQNQSGASSVHSKTTSYEREDAPLQWFTPIYIFLLWTLYIDNIIRKCDLKTVSLGWWFS